MTESQRNIYINIRAEQIKHFQDTRNGHLFNNPLYRKSKTNS